VALAQEGGASGVLDEIIVTATKREASIQDISISVTAIGEEALALGGINDISRVADLVPGMTWGKSGNEGVFKFFAGECLRLSGDYVPSVRPGVNVEVTREALGVVGLITPWNFPLAMATRKVAPALAAGCTVVIRPASATPLTTLLLAKTFLEAGLPAGVLNVITGLDHAVTDAILEDPRLRKLSFTGSTGVGANLLGKAAKHVLRTSMELGGNAPFIVFDDADLDQAIIGAKGAKMRNMGEVCIAANRFIVHESVAEEFTDKMIEMMSGLVVGDGLDEKSEVGPMITERDREKVDGLVRSAIEAGATLRCGGEIPEDKGWFYPPTVLSGVPADAEIMQTEIFGPVAPITTFRTEEEALALANSVPVGLAGYVFTGDTARILQMGQKLETGTIGASLGVFSNAAAPFGGVKESGLGREGSYQGIEEFLETIYVALPA